MYDNRCGCYDCDRLEGVEDIQKGICKIQEGIQCIREGLANICKCCVREGIKGIRKGLCKVEEGLCDIVRGIKDMGYNSGCAGKKDIQMSDVRRHGSNSKRTLRSRRRLSQYC